MSRRSGYGTECRVPTPPATGAGRPVYTTHSLPGTWALSVKGLLVYVHLMLQACEDQTPKGAPACPAEAGEASDASWGCRKGLSASPDSGSSENVSAWHVRHGVPL